MAAALLALHCALIAACGTMRVVVEAPDLGMPLVTPLPLHVGFNATPQVRGYAYDFEYLDLRYEVGGAAVAAFAAAAKAGFEQVVDLSGTVSGAAGTLDAIVELTQLDWTESPGGLVQGAFEFRFATAAGETISTWTTTQAASPGQCRPDPGDGLKFKDEPHGLVIERAMAAFLRDSREDPAVRQWLEQRASYRPAMPDSDESSAGAKLAPPQSRIHVLSDDASDAVRRCVISGLRAKMGADAVVTGGGVRRALFPWLTDWPPVPVAVERLSALSRVQEARERLATLGVGRFVLVTGGTTQDWHGGIMCGASVGGGGCLGLKWGDRDTVISARLFVVGEAPDESESSAVRHGKAVIPAFILPLPFIPATQGAACDDVSEALSGRLKGRSGASPDVRQP